MVKQFERREWDGKYLVPVSRQKSHGGYRESRKYYGSQPDNKLKILNIENVTNLYLSVINNPEPNKHGGYKYLITSGATSHTAFYTENGLKRYLKRTGLKRKFVSKNSYGKYYKLIGSYQRISMSGNWKLLNEFGRKKGYTRTKILSNGDYTTAWYDGEGKIYYLNPNYPRTIYNHFRE